MSDQEKLKLTIKPFEHFASLEFIDAKGYLKEIWRKLPNQNHFAYEVFYKLIAPSLFPQYDKIIVSDVDVVFLGDVTKAFFEFDSKESYLLGGVVSNDPSAFFPIPSSGWRSGYKNFNREELEAIRYGAGGGYLIINLQKWRENHIQDKAIQCLYSNSSKLVLAEQDVLNLVCFRKIKKIPLAHIVAHNSWRDLGDQWEKFKPKIYTQDEINEARDHPIQIYYVGANKPWNTPSEPKATLWFSYLCQTPFLQDYLNSLEERMFAKFQKQQISYRLKSFIKKNPLFIFQKNFYKKFFTSFKKHNP